MKKIIIALFLLLSFLPPVLADAHELIPKALQEYIAANPNATPQEIKAFADNQSPEFAEKFKDGAEILQIVRQPDTSFFDNFKDFFKIGVSHILAGLDHILFVLTLLFVFKNWKEILNLTGTFTIAHSITLVLAGSGILTLSPSLVEPLIALSIAYMAITSVFLKGTRYIGEQSGKIASVFFFGLFHGLGFAGLIQEISIPTNYVISSLVAFNFGIEIGQLVIVGLVFPVAYYCRDKTWYPRSIKILAFFITTIALFWFIERIIG